MSSSGKNGLSGFIKTKFHFAFVLKKNTQVRHRNGGLMEVRHKIHDLKIGEYRTWQDQLWGMKVKKEEGYVI